jgi:hypothetical protein
LPQLFARGLNSRIGHCLFVRGPEPGPFILGEVREHPGATLILELADWTVGTLGRLCEKIGRQERDAGKGGNEEESQLQFHLFVL